MWNKATRVKSSVESASNKHVGGILMVCVGIDVAKDKHDCFILREALIKSARAGSRRFCLRRKF